MNKLFKGGRSAMPKYNSAENEKVFNSAENWCFSALLNKNFNFGALDFGPVERPSKGITIVPKYNSAENKFIVQQFQKSSVFGTAVLRHCCTAPFKAA